MLTRLRVVSLLFSLLSETVSKPREKDGRKRCTKGLAQQFFCLAVFFRSHARRTQRKRDNSWSCVNTRSLKARSNHSEKICCLLSQSDAQPHVMIVSSFFLFSPCSVSQQFQSSQCLGQVQTPYFT